MKEKLNVLDFEINEFTDVKEPEPSIYVGGSTFSARGEISFISGKAKAGKTSLASVMLAGCLTENNDFDTLGTNGVYCEGLPIIYVDTEQSKISSKKIIDRVLRLCKLDAKPDNFKMINIRTPNKEDKKELVKQCFTVYGKPYLVFIDGLGDLATANDERESIEIVALFAKLAEIHNTSVILFLHETPTGDKMRGHLGSECERKCYATISISKNRKEQTHAITPKMFRESADFKPILFEWDTQNKGMITIEGKAKKENESIFDLRDLIEENEEVKHGEFCERVMKKFCVSLSTAKSKITKTLDLNKIEKLELSKRDVRYKLKPILVPQELQQ